MAFTIINGVQLNLKDYWLLPFWSGFDPFFNWSSKWRINKKSLWDSVTWKPPLNRRQQEDGASYAKVHRRDVESGRRLIFPINRPLDSIVKDLEPRLWRKPKRLGLHPVWGCVSRSITWRATGCRLRSKPQERANSPSKLQVFVVYIFVVCCSYSPDRRQAFQGPQPSHYLALRRPRKNIGRFPWKS